MLSKIKWARSKINTIEYTGYTLHSRMVMGNEVGFSRFQGRKEMEKIQKAKGAKEKDSARQKDKAYKAPKLVVHSGAEFVRKLGPAQACSGSPDLY